MTGTLHYKIIQIGFTVDSQVWEVLTLSTTFGSQRTLPKYTPSVLGGILKTSKDHKRDSRTVVVLWRERRERENPLSFLSIKGQRTSRQIGRKTTILRNGRWNSLKRFRKGFVFHKERIFFVTTVDNSIILHMKQSILNHYYWENNCELKR